MQEHLHHKNGHSIYVLLEINRKLILAWAGYLASCILAFAKIDHPFHSPLHCFSFNCMFHTRLSTFAMATQQATSRMLASHWSVIPVVSCIVSAIFRSSPPPQCVELSTQSSSFCRVSLPSYWSWQHLHSTHAPSVQPLVATKCCVFESEGKHRSRGSKRNRYTTVSLCICYRKLCAMPAVE